MGYVGLVPEMTPGGPPAARESITFLQWTCLLHRCVMTHKAVCAFCVLRQISSSFFFFEKDLLSFELLDINIVQELEKVPANTPAGKFYIIVILLWSKIVLITDNRLIFISTFLICFCLCRYDPMHVPSATLWIYIRKAWIRLGKREWRTYRHEKTPR